MKGWLERSLPWAAYATLRLGIREKKALLEDWSKDSDEHRRARHLVRLRAVVAAAIQSPAYRERYVGVGLNSENLKSIEDFRARVPVADKDVVNAAAKHARRGWFPGVRRQTAGSSGVVTNVVMSRELLGWTLAARAVAYGWYGVDLGDREGRLWGRTFAPTLRSRMMDMALNRRIFPVRSGNHDSDDEIVREVIRFRPKYLYGYSSLIAQLAPTAARVEQGFSDCRLVVCTAEQLLNWQRSQIADAFDSVVAVEYGCTEVDIIAFECALGSCHVFSDRCYIEIDGGDDLSGEVLITDLWNTTSPVIRYRLGDTVRLSTHRCACGVTWPVLTELIGRTNNRFVRTPDGRVVHAVTFAHMVESLIGKGRPVRSFQVVQNGPESLLIRLELDRVSDREVSEAHCVAWVANHIGSGLRVEFSYDSVRTVDGRKHAYFVALQAPGNDAEHGVRL